MPSTMDVRSFGSRLCQSLLNHRLTASSCERLRAMDRVRRGIGVVVESDLLLQKEVAEFSMSRRRGTSASVLSRTK